MTNLISLALFFGIFVLAARIRKVPSNTVHIIDRNTHYLKTVRKGYYFFNPSTDKVTTKISTSPIYTTYSNYYESEDGKAVRVIFNISYSASNLEDVLYNLDKTRRSIDDVLQGAMYHAVISLKSPMINEVSLNNEFKRNLESQALPLCIKINSYKITYLDLNRYSKNTVKLFTPHKSRSLNQNDDPIQY